MGTFTLKGTGLIRASQAASCGLFGAGTDRLLAAVVNDKTSPLYLVRVLTLARCMCMVSFTTVLESRGYVPVLRLRN